MDDEERDRRLSGRLARLVVRGRWLVVAFWIAAAAAGHLLLPPLTDAGGSLGLPIADDAPALHAEVRSVERFGFPLISRTLVVQRDPGGLPPGAETRAIQKAVSVTAGERPELGILAAVPVPNAGGLFPGSREAGTTVVTHLYLPPEVSFGTRTERAARYAAEIPPGDGLVGVTGSAPAREAQARIIQGDLAQVVGLTVVMILLVVAVALRGVGAALLVLVVVAVTHLVNLSITGLVAVETGLAITPDVEPVITALLLGVTTDYAVFFMFGMRARLAAGQDRLQAAARTAAAYGPIVVTAGLTVAGGTAALLAAQIDFYRAFGPALAVTAFVAMLVAATLVPALLAIAGRAVFWPGGTAGGAPPRATRGRGGLNRLLVRRRVAGVVTAAVVVGLLAAASGLRDTTLDFGLLESLPPGTETVRAAEAAEAGFAAGILGPSVLLVEGEGLGQRRQGLARLGQELAGQPSVAGLLGPGATAGTGVRGLFVSRDGNAARYLLLFRDRPTAPGTIAALSRIERRLPAMLARAGLAPERFGVAGNTALARATIEETESALVRLGIAALVANVLLLSLFLRSVIAPLYLLATSVLSVAAALGLAAYVFDGGPAEGSLVYYVPFAAAVLLLALGSDYNIFLVGGVWHEADRVSLRQAVVTAVPRASRPISVAGLVLAVSFALLGLVPLEAMRQFAVVMGLGILIDAFLVRTLLVPALITLVGPAGRWPRRSSAGAPPS